MDAHALGLLRNLASVSASNGMFMFMFMFR